MLTAAAFHLLILDFIRVFLQRVSQLEQQDNTSVVCREAYEQTLARHHTFLVKNGAKLAMYALPNRDELLKRVSETSSNLAVISARHIPFAFCKLFRH